MTSPTPKPPAAGPPPARQGRPAGPLPSTQARDGQGNRAAAAYSAAAAAPQASGTAASELVYAQSLSSISSAMSEAQLENGVRRILKNLPDVLWYHTHDSRRSPSGYPDLVCVGPGGVLYRELKTMRGRVTKAQDEWLFALTFAGADAQVWRPVDLLSGHIARELAAISGLGEPRLRRAREGDFSGPVSEGKRGASVSLSPYWSDDQVTLHLGDCLEVLAEMETGSVDAIVTDPPAAISFMGKDWDGNLGSRDNWIAWLAERMKQAARVLKPGGHALVWALPRTSGWTQIALEDAGLEIRDSIDHIFGQGFPKSLNVSKAIDKAAGAERKVVGKGINYDAKVKHGGTWTGGTYAQDPYTGADGPLITAPATEDAAQWEGWGTALKPAHEVWWLARKPLSGSVVQNVLQFGTGALNVAACLVEPTGESRVRVGEPSQESRYADSGGTDFAALPGVRGGGPAGRWPPNILFSHSPDCEPAGIRKVRTAGSRKSVNSGSVSIFGIGQPGHIYGDHGVEEMEAWNCVPGCPIAELDGQSGVRVSGDAPTRRGSAVFKDCYGEFAGQAECPPGRTANSGGASRFFPIFRYEAKASSAERPRLEDGTTHETVKSLALMRWLVRLITPPGGLVADLFAGSGPTAEACIIEGFRCVLIEKERSSCELIRTRLRKDIQPVMFGEVS